MRNVRLFRALLGVDKRTVIEDIEFEEDDAGDGARVIARVRPRSAVLRAVVAAVARRPGMTAVRACANGAVWIGAPSRCSWRPRRRG
ncbi:Transposase [Mycobacterium tuberculosis]|nr:Transposase [Mycobacterium tuberculosis]